VKNRILSLTKNKDYYTCADNYNPGKLLNHKWENCMPLDLNSWGYRRNMYLGNLNFS
jgi:alpha-L-fucosidase